MTKQRFGLVLICCCFLFPKFILAALQNVTVDDAVLTGAVVPQYLPSTSDWNIGQDCSGCLVKPSIDQAYNGTWHDTTYSPGNNYTQTIQFNFTGSALYIFFILANSVQYATTNTSLNFNLDGISSASFQHNPTTSTAYEYNQAVYANDSLANGLHTMTIEPAFNTGTNVLMLFDYVIYTQDTGTTTSTDSASQVITTTPSPTQTESGSSGTSSGSNTGAIVGGVVAGAAVVALVAAYGLCYRPYKRRRAGHSASANGTSADPFIISPVDPTSSVSSSLPAHQIPWGSPVITPASESRNKVTHGVLLPHIQRSGPPSSVPAASNASSSLSGSGTSDILEQMGLLRNEVARLRELQTQNRNLVELDSEAPPEYCR